MRSVEENSDGKVRRAALIVPHPRMHERRFVLEPLCEIAPDLIHPALGQTCREMLAALGDRSTIRLYKRGKHIEH
jgi:2-amino-4-hydroxy-6-hydroxymethyldihydropteridine diphosphokinase